MLHLVEKNLSLTLSDNLLGGGSHGVMGAVNRGARSMNGKIIGVIHEKWCVDGTEDILIADMIVVGMISVYLLSICAVRVAVAAEHDFHFCIIVCGFTSQ